MSTAISRRRVHRRANPAELNAHEARVARLVASGASNRCVGEILGVSTRAVEHHLTRVYRKLWISGRDQLRFALEDEMGSGVPDNADDSTGVESFRP
ncbi:hypothetical protein GCM10009665_44030 [Kitasatospora nipponensis]|uniref:HTH luxR-type domain-containing protein n=1 Tax=Kitasatospora nipponensis TaxID=258049 RepID=A0ABN1WHC5_9ACTN